MILYNFSQNINISSESGLYYRLMKILLSGNTEEIETCETVFHYSSERKSIIKVINIHELYSNIKNITIYKGFTAAYQFRDYLKRSMPILIIFSKKFRHLLVSIYIFFNFLKINDFSMINS